MNTWRKRILIALPILLVGVNLFLIEKKDSQIARVERVQDWQKVKTDSMKSTFMTKGVVAPEEEHPIYFDREKAGFKQFLVSEGDEVVPGTPLFEYSTSRADEDIQRLRTEANDLENKADRIEETISQLEKLLKQVEKAEKDEPAAVNTYWIENEIFKNEQQLDFLLYEAAKLEEQIKLLEDGYDLFVVKSDVEGYVKELHYDLSHPIMTISSKNLSVTGRLTESEVKRVSEGMTAVVSLPKKKEWQGSIANISPLPDEKPEVEKASIYPVKIALEDESGDALFAGKHVDVEITLKESEHALIVPASSLRKEKKKTFVYILTPSGTIDKRAVQTGIHENGYVEITDGVSKDEYLAVDGKSRSYQTGAAFTTPLQVKDLAKSSLKKSIKTEWKTIVRGFLSR